MSQYLPTCDLSEVGAYMNVAISTNWAVAVVAQRARRRRVKRDFSYCVVVIFKR
jgi:hypothetical protein